MKKQEIYKVLIDTLKPGTDKGSPQAIIDKRDISTAADIIAIKIERIPLQTHLDNFRRKVIGITNYIGDMLLVTSIEEGTITAVYITSLGGIHTHYLPEEKVEVHLFPDNKNLIQMLEDPRSWSDFLYKIKY